MMFMIKKLRRKRSSHRLKMDLPQYMMQVTIAPILAGVHWIMHEYDSDINDPSCPHCHAKEKNWKLDIYSGCVYDYTNGKVCITKLSKKEFKRLWRQKGFLSLVLKERKWYEDEFQSKDSARYPPLPPMPSIGVSKKHGKLYLHIRSGWINKRF